MEKSFKQFLTESEAMATVYHVSPKPNLISIRPERTEAKTGSKLGRGVFVAPKFKDALAWASSYVQFKKQGSGEGEGSPKPYKNLTVYELKIPRSMLKTLYYANWWEPEYFVPEELSNQIEIVSSKTMSMNQIQDMYRRSLAQYFSSRQGKSEMSRIRDVSKTNIAAKLYLDLFEKYSRARMRGIHDRDVIHLNPARKPSPFRGWVIDSGRTLEEEIKKALETLKGMSIKESPSDFLRKIPVPVLNPSEESIARKTYEDATRILRDAR
jgi:hypothetical protein